MTRGSRERDACCTTNVWRPMAQVLEWTQMMLKIGEVFSGEPCTSLRDAVQRQSGRFFQVCGIAHYASVIEACRLSEGQACHNLRMHRHPRSRARQ